MPVHTHTHTHTHMHTHTHTCTHTHMHTHAYTHTHTHTHTCTHYIWMQVVCRQFLLEADWSVTLSKIWSPSVLLLSYVSLQQVGSILHGVDPMSYFSFQPVFHDWLNKGCGMCYPVCEMVHIKEPLLLIGKNSQCGGSGFPLSIRMVLNHMSDAI